MVSLHWAILQYNHRKAQVGCMDPEVQGIFLLACGHSALPKALAFLMPANIRISYKCSPSITFQLTFSNLLIKKGIHTYINMFTSRPERNHADPVKGLCQFAFICVGYERWDAKEARQNLISSLKSAFSPTSMKRIRLTTYVNIPIRIQLHNSLTHFSKIISWQPNMPCFTYTMRILPNDLVDRK